MQKYINDITPSQFKLIVSALILLIAVALYLYLLQPQVTAFREANKMRVMLESVVENNTQLTNQLKQKKNEVVTLDKRLHGDMANLAARQMEAYIIGRLQNISWKHKVELAGLRPTKGEAIKKFREILFDVDVSGDYLNLYAWLRDLSKELGFVVIKQFEINPIEQNVEYPRLRVKLTMASYRSIQ